VAVGALRACNAAARDGVLAGRTVWLADNPEQPQLLVSTGLPRGALFARMFGAGAQADTADAAPDAGSGAQEDEAA
jgi:hypothetical protein